MANSMSRSTLRQGALRGAWWLAFVTVTVATHAPPSSTPQVGHGLDKAVHVLLFGSLGALAVLCWPRHAYRAVALLLLWAAADEYTQAWVGRQPDLLDWIADVVGIVGGAALALHRHGKSRATSL